MNDDQLKKLHDLEETSKDLGEEWIDYWQKYSNLDTWQFWVNVALLVIPLVVLFLKLNRKRAFHLGFYGFSVHVFSTYVDSYSTRFGNWEYPYQVIPFLPMNFGLDTSLIPVVYMLTYQWTINHKKNYYIAIFIAAAIFSFLFKPFMSYLHLFQLSNGTTYLHLFFWYLLGGFVSKWITNLFLYFEKGSNSR
ncbi:CBO0543 family protein [Neobacillus sp. D3-1R]|uniref:CBO0543 family protein n=1 Tax=Neobacillus sp. D3-1R TaxID=3445778 RepID=UPI003FA0B906